MNNREKGSFEDAGAARETADDRRGLNSPRELEGNSGPHSTPSETNLMSASGQADFGNSRFSRSSRGRTLLLGLLLVFTTVIAYQRAWHAGFIWDDDDYVIKNVLLTAPDGLKRIWFSLDSPSQYFPLAYTTFRLERSLWGLNATGYHWVNIMLHVMAALLVWRLLKRLNVPGSWLAAAVFSLHPVQVESVAWITELKSVLSLFFSLLALLAWVEFVGERRKHPWGYYVLTIVFYALALFSKTTACTLPAALLLVLWLRRQPINWRRLVQMVPFLALGLGMGLVTMWWERYHQGTHGKPFELGFLDRIIIASHAVWFYAGKLLWPSNLTFSYPRWAVNSSNPWAYGWLAAGVGVCAVVAYVRRYVGRGLEVALAFYVVTLAPVLGFIMLYTFLWSFVADHYQYVASIGPIALAAAAIRWAFGRLKRKRLFAESAFSGALLAVLGVLTWRQCGMYANVETLWRTTYARNPSSWLATYNLGTFLGEKGKVDEAISWLEKTAKIRPQFAGGHYNLGSLLLYKGQVDQAISEFRKTLEYDPTHALAYYKLGNALLKKGSVQEAVLNYQRALQIYPGCADAHRSLGGVLLEAGHVDEAIAHFQEAIQLQPDDAAAHIYLGNALLRKGQLDQAILQFRKAAQIHPDFLAHNNLGNALLQQGRIREAIEEFHKSLEIRPDNVLSLNNLAWVLATSPDASTRNGAEAVRLAEQADRLAHGQNPFITGTLAAAYAEAGSFSNAVATARRAQKTAAAQKNEGLVSSLETQIKLYESGSPFHTPASGSASHKPKPE